MPLTYAACVLCTRPTKESRHQPQSRLLAAPACKGRCTYRERGQGVMPPSVPHTSTPCCDAWGCCMGLGSGTQRTGAPLAAGCCMVREVVAHRRELRHTVTTTAGTGLNDMLVGQQHLACAARHQRMGANVFATICPSWAIGKCFTGSYLAAVQLALVPTCTVVQVVLVHTRLLLRMQSAPCNGAGLRVCRPRPCPWASCVKC